MTEAGSEQEFGWEQGVMWVKCPKTAEVLPIERDKAFTADDQAYWQADCKHEDSATMRVPIKGGAIQVRDCCTRCGTRVGNPYSQADKSWVAGLPLLSDELAGSYSALRHSERKALMLKHAYRQREERGRFTHGYRAYLQSPEWKAKRAKVMKRCGGICEGCGDEPAVHAHHVTYDHFGNEFLFELLGLCEACHERVHADEHP